MDKQTYNIIFAGVGGQGILLASDAVCDVALLNGYDAKKSEVHGMAQRGGSVVSQVRCGEKIYSPLIPKGQADIIVAFEKLEALRYLDQLKQGGMVIANNHQIMPQTVLMGKATYPRDVLGLCQARAKIVIFEPLTDLAVQLGNIRVLNVLMLGILANFLPFTEESWWQALERRVPGKVLDLNKKAFAEGQAIGHRFVDLYQDLISRQED